MYNRPRIRRALPGTFVLAAVLICSFPIIGASVIPAEGQTATRRGDAKTGPPPASRAASRGEVQGEGRSGRGGPSAGCASGGSRGGLDGG